MAWGQRDITAGVLGGDKGALSGEVAGMGAVKKFTFFCFYG